MLKSYLKIAFRSIRRHPIYAFINVTSLTVGFAACLVIWIYIQDERSYDQMNDNAEHTFRFVRQWEASGPRPNTPAPLGPLVVSEYPEVKTMTRVFRYWHDPLLSRDQTAFIETGIYFVDSTFFDVFSFPLEQGSLASALRAPDSIVLTEGLARKYFGEEDPIGKTISYDVDHPLTVTGILAPIPHNVHFHPDALVPMSALPELAFSRILDLWGMNAFKTYVVLEDGTTPERFDARIKDFFKRHRGDSTSVMYVQPLTDIHLHSRLRDEFEDNGDARFLLLLGTIGMLILAIACINYMNIATARSTGRALEVGLRKTVGARKRQLLQQFFSESVILAIVAAVLAVGAAQLFLPVLNEVTGKAVGFSVLHWADVVGMIAIVLGSGILAGAYPALILSQFRPADVLKGATMPGSRTARVRSGLVVVQFVASIVLIVGTIVVVRQLAFLKTTDLGFDRDQVLIVPVEDQTMRDKVDAISDRFAAVPGVLSVGSVNQYPGDQHATSTAIWEGGAEGEEISISITWLYDNYIDAMGMRMAAGRTIDRTHASDLEGAVMINEAAARSIGWSNEEAVGKWITCDADSRERMRIVGVVKDYNFKSLHTPIEPLMFYLNETAGRNMVVRVGLDDVSRTIGGLKKAWDAMAPSQPFIYRFLDEEFDRQYLNDERWGTMMGWAAIVAMLIACLGLFGLTAFSAVQRTKEVGVRKVLGATVPDIAILLSGDAIKLVGIAFLLAVPIAWFAGSQWLESFAYTVDVGVGIFIQAGLVTAILTVATVAVLAIRSAIANPAKSLRYE